MFMTTRRRIAAVALLVVAAIAGAGLALGLASGDDEHPITGAELEQASAAALAHTGEGRVTDTEVGDEEGFYEVEITLDDGTEVDVHLDQGLNVLSTESDGPDGDDRPLTESDFERASDAALEHTGGGRVVDAEVSDEGGSYEVEVLLEDGSEIDITLDENFNVIRTEADGPDGD